MSDQTMTNAFDKVRHANDPFEPGRVTVIAREPVAPNLQLLSVQAPVVASKIRPGQFVIVRADERGERIPLTVADWDRERGSVSCVFMQIGTSTYKLGQLKPGDVVATFVGPLGKPLEIDRWGTVLVAGGCYGIGSIYPVARALKEKGNRVIALIEGRSKFLLYWLDRLQAVSDRLLISTRDLSLGNDRDGPNALANLLASGERVDRVIAVGCTFIMYLMAGATRPYSVKTIVSLNPIMIDGTGMCGAC
jgi:ferredoxin--NADP+ reductase